MSPLVSNAMKLGWRPVGVMCLTHDNREFVAVTGQSGRVGHWVEYKQSVCVQGEVIALGKKD